MNQKSPEKDQNIANSPLRVVYMGTPDFAVPALKALIDSHHEVVGVFTQPDRKGGRGKKMLLPPVKVEAEKSDIPVYQPERVRKNAEALKTLQDWRPDVVVVAAYGQILPQSVLDVPRLGCINIHASILPKYRGAAPINWAIVHGDKESGVTLMEMEAGLDTGPILEIHRVDITPVMNAQELHDSLSDLGGDVLIDALDKLGAGDLPGTVQDDEASSYAPMLSRASGRIEWQKSAQELVDHIRGFYPWPGSFALRELPQQEQQEGDEQKGEDAEPEYSTLKIHAACVAKDAQTDAAPGTIIEADCSAGTLHIATGQGVLELLKVQAPGKRAMKARDFLNGCDFVVGERLL